MTSKGVSPGGGEPPSPRPVAGERLAGTGPPLGKVTVSAPPTILQMRSPRCRQWTRKRLPPDGNTRTPKPRVRGRGCSRGRSR